MPGGRHHQDDRHMTLRDHVQELTRRFLLLVSILLVSSSLVYVYRATIIPVILQPMTVTFGDQKLMYLNPAGGFNFIFLISIYAGVAVAAPVVIQQLYAFIRPTLPKHAQKLSARLLLSSFFLMIVGILFGYFIAVPGALQFLSEFAGEYVSAALTADSYLNFLIAYTLGLGLLFQIPFVVIIGHYIKPFTPNGLIQSERWAIVLAFIAAAIITPTPDPINLMIVALPLVLIYQIGVVYVLISMYKEKRQKKRQALVGKQARQAAAVVPRPVVQPEPLPVEPVITLTQTPEKPPVKRSMDGFVRANARSTPVMQVPVRGVEKPQSRSVTPRVKNNAPYRYLDGVSMMIPQ